MFAGPTNQSRGAGRQHARTTVCVAAIVVLLTDIGVRCDLAANTLLIDAQLERFRIRDICSANNRNLRLYLDYADSGWVSGYSRAHQLQHMVNDFAVSPLHRGEQRPR